MNSSPLLSAATLSRSFKGSTVTFRLLVEGIVVAGGARVAVIGPSGCGKSTLLGLLSLALRPDHAETLILDGVDAAALWRQNRVDELTALRARCIGFVPQTAGLLSFLTLGENIALPQRILGRSDPAFVQTLTHALGIAAVLQCFPAQVSVGERQRAAVARSLAHRPKVVLADEPTASVHPAQADEILGLLSDVTGKSGAALLITTHDADRARAAGFAVAPCVADTEQAITHFAWPAPQQPFGAQTIHIDQETVP